MAMKVKHILCVGGGLLGLPVAQHFSSEHSVTLIKRSEIANASPIEFRYADLTQPTELTAALPEIADIIVVCLSPSEFSEAGYRQIFISGITNLLKGIEIKQLKPQHLFFVSSTSVYHQKDNQQVNEDSDTLPESFSGKILLEAERLIANSPYNSTIIRFSGIYGGNRTRLLEQARQGKLPRQKNDSYTNRIHEVDCVGVLKHLVSKAVYEEKLLPCYLATDCAPVTTNTLSDWFKSHILCKPEVESITPMKRRSGSKKCDNKQLIESGYQFIFPSWQEGYLEMIQRIYPDERL